MSGILCSQPECQTTAGCKCRRPFGVNFTWGHVKDLPDAKELAALREEVSRLRTELQEARDKALGPIARMKILPEAMGENHGLAGAREIASRELASVVNVRIGREPVAWRWESAYGGEPLIGTWQVSTSKVERQADASSFACEPLYAAPPPQAAANLESVERMSREAAMHQWEASLRRPDLDEHARVLGAIAVYQRQAFACSLPPCAPVPQATEGWPEREDGVDKVLAEYRKFINDRPALTSLLYDIDMLPEQCVTYAGAVRLAGLCEVWRRGEEGNLPASPTPKADGEQP